MRKHLSVLIALYFATSGQISNADNLEYSESSTANSNATNNSDCSLLYLDTNHDGNVSKAEYLSEKANSRKNFKHLDTNKDGQLDKEELKEFEAIYKEVHEKSKPKSTSNDVSHVTSP